MQKYPHFCQLGELCCTLERELAAMAAERDEWVKWASSSRCIFCDEEFHHDPINHMEADEAKKRHVTVCTKHPYATLRAENERLRENKWQRYVFGDGVIHYGAVISGGLHGVCVQPNPLGKRPVREEYPENVGRDAQSLTDEGVLILFRCKEIAEEFISTIRAALDGK